MRYKTYLKSRHWGDVKREAMVHYGRKCADCGARQNLQVHHKQYGSGVLWRETMNDVVLLCNRCHAARHGIKTVR